MKHRLAVIGYGGMGGWHHENIKERVPEIEVVGAYDVRPEALEKAKERGLHAYASQDELLRDKSIDIVTIATPNDFHKPIAIACLEAGKNVVCEKPVTLNAGELEDILAVANRTGKLFTVHQNRRWDKDYRIVKKAIEDGLIGKPYFVESRVQGSRGSMYGWRGHKQNGGGM
ncbi:MAG: Gfo/Idh/MocA family oxidoreductase, partial [Clostridiales bacterium]|nr:Gfo/Idh/MocA family oxidoreductase [Clostridiales bacterium]